MPRTRCTVPSLKPPECQRRSLHSGGYRAAPILRGDLMISYLCVFAVFGFMAGIIIGMI
jgi:hypothetical protein